MALMTYVRKHPKSGVYEFRRAVPEPLIGRIGKREIRRSLGTRDFIEAKRLAHPIASEVERLFRGEPEPARDAVSYSEPPPAAPAPRPVTAEEAERRAKLWLLEHLQRDTARRIHGPALTPAQFAPEAQANARALDMWRTILVQRDWGALTQMIDPILAEYGQDRQSAPEAYNLLAHAFARAFVAYYEPVVARDGGAWPVVNVELGAASPIAVSAQHQPQPAPVAATGSGETLRQLFKLYNEERRLPDKTVVQVEKAIRRFEEATGASLPASAITKAHALEFKRLMLKMPRCLADNLRALPLPALVARFEERGEVQRISPDTVRKDIGLLASIMAWGVAHEKVAANPFQGIKPVGGKSVGKDKKRVRFSEDDLCRIFSAPVFTGRASRRDWAAPGPLIIRDEQFWLPLLGLCTGARLEELGQSKMSDIKRTDGVWYIDINTIEGGGAAKRVKTASSLRVVPLHPLLLRLGFLRYVWRLRRAGETQLFPGLEPDRFGSYTQAFSKWFARFLDRLDISDPRKTFHSLRHGFKTACRAARIAEDVHDALTGHSNGGVGRDYGDEGGLLFLHQEISRISFGPKMEVVLSRLVSKRRQGMAP